MMVKLDLLFKVIGLLISIIGVIWLFVKGFRILRDTQRDHTAKLDFHDEKLKEQEVEMLKIEERVDKKLQKYEEKLDKFIDENKKSHSTLYENQTDMKAMISGIDGYIKGLNNKNEK